MLLEDYIGLLESPDTVSQEDIDDLKALVSYAPYCGSANMLLANALYKSHDTSYESFLGRAVYYAEAPEMLWHLLHPQAIVRKVAVGDSDYFSFMSQMENVAQKSGQSFLELARKFQESRRAMQLDAKKPIVTEKNEIESYKTEKNDPILQKLIALREENLHNSKKSVYFADQMRFIEKAIELRSQNLKNN